ncbi:MAG: B12-binding domain-containing protein [Desulfatiglans sp.]|jgi:methanogenic corrinoid protein MtbC1|nr:B12-binding domain-containing protein [Desulfatiglans sp.]
MMSAISDSSARLFRDEFANLSAVVYKRLELEWQYHLRQKQVPDVHRLFQYAIEFGRLLQVIYRHKLFDSLHKEAKWYAAVFEARGSGHNSFAVVLDSWIIAIQGTIKPPESHELVRPLQDLRDKLPLLIDQAKDPEEIQSQKAESPLLRHLVRGDMQGAREILSSRLSRGESPEHLIVDLLLPTMVTIGQLWELNRVEIFEEHLATEAIRNLLSGLPIMIRGALPATGHRALVSCSPGDEHSLVPMALAAYLEIRGWIVRNLGGSLPASQIALAVASLDPEALFLAFTMLSRLDDALEVIEQTGERSGCRIIFGGRGAVAARSILESRGALVAHDFGEAHLLALRNPSHA